MEFNLNEFIWTIIDFLVFFLLLRVILFKPILKNIEGRRRDIEDSLHRAEAANKEAEALRRDFADQVAAARREAQDIVARAMKDVEETRARKLTEVEEEAARRLEKAQETIRREKDLAITELREEAANLAILAAGKVVERSLDTEDHRRLVRDFIHEVGAKQ
ncbi:MAG: F0F1 ATP synthase subunit B [Firmicutes bacterium]|nr:F0F1 ATP synthase subunit B [Bacillota bacterium]